MRILPIVIICAVLAAPVTAQQEGGDAPADGFAEGLDLLGEGARLMLRGLQSELAPMLQALGEAIDDVNAYELPEVLENGDILIRRKPNSEGDPAQNENPIDL